MKPKVDIHAPYFAARIRYIHEQLKALSCDEKAVRRVYLNERRVILFHLSNIRGKDRIASSTTVRFARSRKKMSKKLIYEHSFPIVMKKFMRALRGYDWCLIGGRAVEVWANPPQTPDLDLLVRFSAKDAKHILAAMGSEGFRLDRKFVDRDSVPMFFFTDTEEHTEVDIIGAFEDVHEWTLERAVKKTVGGVKITVAQPEDIVILKAYAAVSPRREKRERDIAAIQALNDDTDLDIDYIEIVLSQALADTADERRVLVKAGVLKD